MPEPRNPKCILVACPPKLADLFLTLPIFQTLKSAFPQARVTALAAPGGTVILEGHPAVDAVETVPAQEGVSMLANRFRAFHADTFVSLDRSSRMILAAWKAKIPMRIGERNKWHGFFLTNTVRINRAVSDRNEMEYNFELLKPMGVTQFAQKTEFPLPEEDKAWIAQYLEKKGIAPGMPYVVVHPGSEGSGLHWSAEKYGHLLGYLCQVKGLRVVVSSAPGDDKTVSEATASLVTLAPEQKPVIAFTGEMELRQLAALCRGAICLLSGPRGPMRLAAAVGTPTVTIFSPAPEYTPVRWGAWGNENTALVPQNSICRACQVGYCTKHDPMEVLSVSEVTAAMIRYISRVVPLSGSAL